MTLAASLDLGNLGPRVGTPVVFDWDWRWNLKRLLPWLLPLLYWALRRNQSLRSLTAFIPGLLLVAGADLLTWPAGRSLPSDFPAAIAEATITLSAGLTTIWLLSGVPGKRPVSAMGRSFLALLLAMAFNIAVALAYDTCSVLAFAIAYSLCFLMPLSIATAVALILCRRPQKRTLRRFATTLLLAPVAVTFAATLLFLVYGTLRGASTSDLARLGAGFLALGMPCCISIATFVVFTCINAEYRDRWRNDLAVAAEVPATGTGASVENTDE